MKTEREFFEEWHNKEYADKLEWDSKKEEYKDYIDEVMWQTWQASAQREGYKLVPLQPPNEVIVAIEKKVENQLEASGINQDPFRLDGETIYEAMIRVVDSPLSFALNHAHNKLKENADRLIKHQDSQMGAAE